MMKLGNYYNPFTVSKSGNHNLSLERTLSIVDAAIDGGADQPNRNAYALCPDRPVEDGLLAFFLHSGKNGRRLVGVNQP